MSCEDILISEKSLHYILQKLVFFQLKFSKRANP